MAWSPSDDSVLSSDGAGALTVASVTASGDLGSATVTATGNATVGGTFGVTGATTLTGVLNLASGLNLPRRTNTAGGACAIAPTDFYVGISSNGGGTVVISETMADGQLALIEMTAFDTDAYTMTVGGGTLTFNAVDESALIFHNGTEVIVVALSGATIV